MNDDTVACPSCGTRFRVRPEVAGRAVRCSRCGEVFTMPAAGGQKPARAPAADAIKAHGAAPGAKPGHGGTPRGTTARGGVPSSDTARGAAPGSNTVRGDAPGPHTVRGGAPSSNAAGSGAPQADARHAGGAMAADGQVGTPDGIEAHGGALDEMDAIPQPGDAPAVGELGLSVGGGPVIHEPAARQGQAGKTSESACAACGRTLAPSAVICVACGFDRRTGQRVDSELA